MADEPRKNRLSAAGWLTIVILFALLGWAGWYAVQSWSEMADVHMSGFGWTFLILGVVVTFAVGAGLMALLFYSSRHDYDR